MDAPTSVSAFTVVAWPVLATTLVYDAGLYGSTAASSAGDVLFHRQCADRACAVGPDPVAFVFGGMLVGWMGEAAAIMAILLTTPLVVLLVTVAAFLWARRFAVPQSAERAADAM